VELEITPEPDEDERAAIVAALAVPEQPVSAWAAGSPEAEETERP